MSIETVLEQSLFILKFYITTVYIFKFLCGKYNITLFIIALIFITLCADNSYFIASLILSLGVYFIVSNFALKMYFFQQYLSLKMWFLLAVKIRIDILEF